ncbi:ChrR family anti-sigma-E factor [Xanthobacter sp. KR7-65]|uniref:ChrR family anti-sigma-E factor n=1 Tax=Xanthobacter sp. KR7-65 TaxID=3156612 RepID=UPI0032B3E441
MSAGLSPGSHPGDETLLRYAAGTLPSGPRLVVQVHLSGCPACRSAVAGFEAVGGALLEAETPAATAPDALSRALSRLDTPALPPRGEAGPAVVRPRGLPDGLVLPPGVALPAPLGSRRMGPMIAIAPGVRVGMVRLDEDPDAQVLLLRIGPGRAIPSHTHSGTEFTQIICGRYGDDFGHYGPGDLVEADGDVDHTPRVEGTEDCICLVAFDGRIRFRGLLGVVTRPFL